MTRAVLMQGEVPVWDALVRLFHWGLATAFVLAYLSEDDWLGLHVWAGYAILALLGVRLIWGFIGPSHARWADFIQGPTEILNYVKQALSYTARRHIGHNPAGGAMVVALMVSLTATAITGLALFAAQELSGPLAPLLSGLGGAWGDLLEGVHETFANLTLVLVVLHLAGVLLASLQHRENLVKAMITGKKRGESE